MPSSAFFVFGTVAGTLQRSTQLWTLRAARPATAARGTEPDGGAFGHRCLGSCKRARARRYPPWPGCRNQCPFWDTVFRILAQGTPQKKTGQIPALKGAHLMFQHALGVLLPRSPAPPLALQSFLCKNAPLLKAGVARGGGDSGTSHTFFAPMVCTPLRREKFAATSKAWKPCVRLATRKVMFWPCHLSTPCKGKRFLVVTPPPMKLCKGNLKGPLPHHNAMVAMSLSSHQLVRF